MKNENLEPLPEQFSICSSLAIKYFRDYPTFFSLRTKDNSFWLAVKIQQDLSVERYSLWFMSNSGNIMGGTKVHLKPWAWSHLCVGLYLINDVVYMSMNGIMMPNVTINGQEFRRSKPTNLQHRFQLGDWAYPGWKIYQIESPVSNVHVYSRLLAIDEMKRFTTERVCTQIGDYLSWDNMEWKLFGKTKVETIENGELCYKENFLQNAYLFTEKFGWTACVDLCQKMNKGRMPIITNKEEIQKLMNWTSRIDSSIQYIWTPYTDEEKESVWKSHYKDHDFSLYDSFLKGQPNGNRDQNCLILNERGLYDIECNDGISIYNCPCKFGAKPILKLSGLCSKSNLNILYTLNQNENVAFYSLKDTKIQYDKISKIWEATIVAMHTKAFTKTQDGQSTILGKHNWRIQNDSTAFSEGKPNEAVLKY